MPNFLARSTVAILLALQFLSPNFVFSHQETRQRRTQVRSEPEKTAATPASGEWRPPAVPAGVTLDQSGAASSTQAEPIIRVALATDVRSATVSTAGHLLNASDEGPTLAAMDVARVRLEPRLLSPLPATDNFDAFRIQIAGLPARDDAEQKAKEVQEASGEDSQIIYDTDTKTWGLLIGARRPQLEAEELRARLESAGLDATVISGNEASAPGNAATRQATPGSQTIQLPIAAKGDSTQQTPRPVRPAARFSLPTREVVASAPGAGRLFSSSAPVVFASDSETTPVRFDDRPYRGRIEVFTNTRGALTVVNVLGLEDYVKGDRKSVV